MIWFTGSLSARRKRLQGIIRVRSLLALIRLPCSMSKYLANPAQRHWRERNWQCCQRAAMLAHEQAARGIAIQAMRQFQLHIRP